MCVDCIRQFALDIEKLAMQPEGNPLTLEAQAVLRMLCAGHDEYSNIIHMLVIFLCEFPGACDQVAVDMDKTSTSLAASRAKAVLPVNDPRTDETLKAFAPKVTH